MKGKTVPLNGARRARKLHTLLNLSLVLLMLFAVAGVAAAQDTPPAAERTAADPYEQWTDEFLDFVPPNPETLDLAQPDGATVEVNLTPMETGGQIETADGYTIVKDADGWWTYAQVDGEGNSIPSALKVGKDVPRGIAKKLGQTPPGWLDANGNDKRDAVFEAVKTCSRPMPRSSKRPHRRGTALPTKNYHYVVILADFQDVKF